MAPAAQSWAGSATVPTRRLSRKTALSTSWSDTSKIEKTTLCAPGVIGVEAERIGVAPSYVVPAALSRLIDVPPAALMLIGACVGSNAKFLGAATELPLIRQVDPGDTGSSSARNESLNMPCRNSGYSSDRNRKSTLRQFAPAGTVTPTRSTVASKAPPRVVAPPRLVDTSSEMSGRSSSLPFGPSAASAEPLVRIANVDPSVGNPSSVEVPTPFELGATLTV